MRYRGIRGEREPFAFVPFSLIISLCISLSLFPLFSYFFHAFWKFYTFTLNGRNFILFIIQELLLLNFFTWAIKGKIDGVVIMLAYHIRHRDDVNMQRQMW